MLLFVCRRRNYSSVNYYSISDIELKSMKNVITERVMLIQMYLLYHLCLTCITMATPELVVTVVSQEDIVP
jgi:hypothetical protein